MSNVSFLRGLHASLPTKGNAIDGAFYLTTDSHRLYVGDSNKNLIDLNKYIITVASINDLSDAEGQIGDFYYAEAENALVLRKENGWKLINQNTDTTNVSAEAAFTVSTETEGIKVDFAHTVIDKEGGEVSANDSFIIKGGNNISVSAENKTITIDGVTYTLAASVKDNEVTLALSDGIGSETSATFKAGTNVSLTKDENNNIIISSNYDNTYIESAETVLNSDGTIQVILTDNDGSKVTSTASNAITYGVGEETFTPGSVLPVYNKDEIDAKFRGINGMSYKGTVGVGGTKEVLPTEGVESGDTYLVVGDSGVNYGIGVANKGDLLIATGTEDANGVLTSITWTYVPSGDEAEHDTHYKFLVDAANNSIKLAETEEGTITGVHTLAVEEDGVLSISSTTGENEGELITTISHNKIAEITPSEKTVADAESVTAVTGVTVDEYGHITGYEVTTSTLLKYTLEGSKTVENNTATFTSTLKDSNGSEISSVSHELSSTSLEVVSTDNGVSVDLNWGTFGQV